MFILSYTAIYFCVNKFLFSNFYVSVNTIFECLYMFFDWKWGPQLSTYATGWRFGGGGYSKCLQLRIGEGSVTRHVHVRTYTNSFLFLVALLSYSVLFYL